jgi:hypothetical protein
MTYVGAFANSDIHPDILIITSIHTFVMGPTNLDKIFCDQTKAAPWVRGC